MIVRLWSRLTNRRSRTLRLKPSPTTRRHAYRPHVELLEKRELLDGNLIANGDFEQGNVAFITGYTYSSGNLVPARTYDVLSNPAAAHPSAASYGDHTKGTGLMMAVNAATTPNVLVWGQTVSVTPNSNYRFSAYVSSWTSTAPAQLDIAINGSSIGSTTAPSATGVWVAFTQVWNSGSATSATIELRNRSNSNVGNNFALDDLSLTSLGQPTTTTLRSSVNTSVYGQPITFTATVTSGGKPVGNGTVSFKEDNTILAAGVPLDSNGHASFVNATLTAADNPHTITAYFSGNANSNTSSGSVRQAVNKARLLVSADNATKSYGQANPVFTVHGSGFVLGQDVSVLGGTLSFSTPATASSNVGSYAITPSGLIASNYTITFVNGTLSITTAPLIVVAANATRSYGAANPVLTGAMIGIQNNDPITATYSTAATPANSVGPYVIVASLSDGGSGKLSNYSVTGINGTLSIFPAPLVVTAANATRPYGAANPAFTGDLAGLQNGDTISANYSSPAAPSSTLGSYPITPTLNDPTSVLGNYTVTLNPGMLTITAAPLTVTTANASRSYGSANPAFTGAIVGLQNGDNITASYSSTASLSSPVGSYALSAMLNDPSGKLANYAVTFNNGTLTVLPAPLLITANSMSRVYGQANPSFTAHGSGFVLGQDASVLGGTLSFSTPATASSNVGSYAITPSGLIASNYTITFVNGTLSITAAPLIVVAANAARSYGAANPVLTGAMIGIQNNDPITATYSTAAIPANTVGPYAIVPSLSDGGSGKLSNYSVTGINGTLSIFPAPLVVTAANATRPYGAANPAFTGNVAGLQNGDTISANYSSPATATSPLDTYPITPTLNDPSNRLANYTVTLNVGSLTVTPAPLSVLVADASCTYGGMNPSLTGTVVGIQNGDNITASYSSPASAASAVGSYAISATLNDPGNKLANYTVSLNTGTLTVQPAALIVTADDKSRGYGQPNSIFSVHYAGFVLGEDAGVLGGALSFAIAANPSSNVGSYAITPSGLTASNYALTFTNGTLSISPAPLTVTAANASRTYGAADPLFTGNIAGLQNGDNITASYSSSASAASPLGSYAISATLNDPGNKLANYTVTFSNGTLTILPAALTVTADDKSRAYGQPNPTFSVHYTGLVLGQDASVLGGTLSFSTPATASNNVGSYAITPSGLTASNYALTFTNGTLSITPAPLTVTAANASRTYGAADPLFTGNIAGLQNGDNITASYSGSASGASPVGSYAISATLNDPGNKLANYTVTFSNGTLTILPASVTVTADDKSRGYGQANPLFSVHYAGLVLGQDASVLGGTLSISTPATAGSNVGAYAITPSGLIASNYAMTFVNGTLSITAAPLTVTAANASRSYGAANPVFAGNLVGLQNGDNITASYSSPAGVASPVGSYAISATLMDPSNRLANYTVAFSNGTLTVLPAALTVTADDTSRLYGQGNPGFTARITGLVLGQDGTVLGGSLTFQTPATASSSVGVYAITPSGLTSGNYTLTFVNGALTVVPAPLSVTAGNASRTYGAANPAFTGNITGLQNGDSITANYSSPASAASPVGSYAITATLYDAGNKLANYTVTFTDGTLTVLPAALTVTADDTSRPYGQPNPIFSVHYTGFVLGQDAGALSGTLTFRTTATVSSPPAAYAITPGGLTSMNYALTFVSGTLTITPASLTVQGLNFTATAGAPFSGAVATFVNADPVGGPGSYTALITWGDGNTSAGTITDAGDGTFHINGSNTYADPTSYAVQVLIQHKRGYTTAATSTGTATVGSLGYGIYARQSASIDFWRSLGGQQLIDMFNGGLNATALANWLALTFPNLYGANAGTNNLFGKSNAQVASFYKSQYQMPGAKVEAETLAAALNVYATTLSLGGMVAISFGFQVTATGLGAQSFNVSADGAAFGVANNATLNVYELLKAVNKQAVGGVLYNGIATLRQQANDLLQFLNEAGGVG